MRVGVFLDDMPPEAGGGFTFTHSVVTAFLGRAKESAHSFVLFCAQAYATRLAAAGLPPNVSVAVMPTRSLVQRGMANLKHYLPLAGLLFRRAGTLQRLAVAKDIQVMWFVGGFHDTIDIPYLSTVWDLQHRTHPWFPEFSADWRWDHRELYYSRHLRRASRLIVGTTVGRAQLQSFYGIPEANIRILPHPTPGFALDAARQTETPPRPLPEAYFLYPAQYWAHKNHANLLLAWQQLIARGGDVPHLVFVGSDKGNRAYIDELAAHAGLSSIVHHMGFVEIDALVALYRHARGLIYPSFSGPENLPPLEAFALGCPVVASEFPGAREQLGEAAIYFDPHSPTSIADAVTRLIEDPQLERQITALGRDIAAGRTSTQFVDGVFALLDEFETERRSWR